MIRRRSLCLLALFLVAPLAVEAQDLRMRVDRSTNAADPDDVEEVTVHEMDGELHVSTGPAVVLWKDSQTAERPFNLGGTFTLGEPSSHANYYGLIYGAGALDGARQNYMYFLIAQNGSYIVKHRAGDQVHDIQGRTRHEAIVTPDSDGQSVNRLEVRVGDAETQFVVNGTVVHTVANEGMAGRTDGIWGVRVNHVIPDMTIADLGVSR